MPQDIVTSRTAIRTVNGLVNPALRMQPGETQFWRIANTGANLYYRLTLGGQKFWVIAEDANPTVRMMPVNGVSARPVGPCRGDGAVSDAGKYVLKTEKVRTGPVGDGYPATELTTVVCEGSAGKPDHAAASSADCCAGSIEDYRKLNIDKKRLIVFNETDNDFRVNNKVFNENRIDTRVPLGTVEEWTIRNSTDELHQFHIHQVDFQVVEINGKPVEFTGHRDNFVIPVRGEVKMIIPFTNPVIVGSFVYHCHIIEHEDGGMMATIEVYDPKKIGEPSTRAETHRHPAGQSELPQGGPIHLTDQQGHGLAGRGHRGGSAVGELRLHALRRSVPEDDCCSSNETLDLLKDSPDRVQPVLVSIDPERDTPAGTARIRRLDPTSGLVTLTGEHSDVTRVAKSFGVADQKAAECADGTYSVSHSTDLFLTTRDGRVLQALRTDHARRRHRRSNPAGARITALRRRHPPSSRLTSGGCHEDAFSSPPDCHCSSRRRASPSPTNPKAAPRTAGRNHGSAPRGSWATARTGSLTRPSM